jgi:hypothetical protein
MLLMSTLTFFYLLTVNCFPTHAQFDSIGGGTAGSVSSGAVDLGNMNPGGLTPGVFGGGEALPGAIALKIVGEIRCLGCTLEEMGVEESPGDLYQFSNENTHMVIQVTRAAPDTAWELVDRHKFFLSPAEDPAPLQKLLSESAPGKRVTITGGVSPQGGYFVPLKVETK